jgi:hypothetical protein
VWSLPRIIYNIVHVEEKINEILLAIKNKNGGFNMAAREPKPK